MLSPHAPMLGTLAVVAAVSAVPVCVFGDRYDAVFLLSLSAMNIGAMFDAVNRRAKKGWRRYLYVPTGSLVALVSSLAVLLLAGALICP